MTLHARYALHLKMFAQGQTLALIRGPECGAIELTGACEHPVVYNLKKCLSIMDQEGHVVGADFQDHLGAVQLAAALSESRIEKSCVVGAQFATGCFEGNHFGCVARGNTNPFFRCETVKLIRFQEETILAVPVQGFPKIERRIMADL